MNEKRAQKITETYQHTLLYKRKTSWRSYPICLEVLQPRSHYKPAQFHRSCSSSRTWSPFWSPLRSNGRCKAQICGTGLHSSDMLEPRNRKWILRHCIRFANLLVFSQSCNCMSFDGMWMGSARGKRHTRKPCRHLPLWRQPCIRCFPRIFHSHCRSPTSNRSWRFHDQNCFGSPPLRNIHPRS